MKSLIAIDPGDAFVGVAFFESEDEDPWASPVQSKWECVDAQEFAPNEFADAFAETILDGDLDTVVFERFRLYGDKANEQKGSEFETSQLIGVIKFLVRIHNVHVQRHADAEANGQMLDCEQAGQWHHDPTKRPRHVHIFGQMADIKKPTAGILRHKKIQSVAKPISREHYNGRDHIVDAELHGWKYILDGDRACLMCE